MELTLTSRSVYFHGGVVQGRVAVAGRDGEASPDGIVLGVTERIGQQNIPNRPFTNEKLAASFGMTCADFEDIPVTVDACNVAYDALAESRSGLIPYADADKRRNEWLNDDGSFNQPRFLTGLAKSRFTVIIAWFIFGKGNFVWVLVFVQALHDVRPDIFPTPKEAGLDKIGFFT